MFFVSNCLVTYVWIYMPGTFFCCFTSHSIAIAVLKFSTWHYFTLNNLLPTILAGGFGETGIVDAAAAAAASATVASAVTANPSAGTAAAAAPVATASPAAPAASAAGARQVGLASLQRPVAVPHRCRSQPRWYVSWQWRPCRELPVATLPSNHEVHCFAELGEIYLIIAWKGLKNHQSHLVLLYNLRQLFLNI